MIIWLDLETTGLNPKSDAILEIAAIATDDHLAELGRFEVVTNAERSVDHAKIARVVDEMHSVNGLWRESHDSAISEARAVLNLLVWLDGIVPVGTRANLAGNSVHFDRSFLVARTGLLDEVLSHRLLDVSAIGECARRWYVEAYDSRPLSAAHRAMPDVLGSIALLRHYMKHIGAVTL